MQNSVSTMRSILVAVALLALPSSAKCEADIDAITAKIVRSHSLSYKGSRKIDLKPVIPRSGINSGCVIAFGHFLRPPFQLQNEGRYLLVNGVRVYPSELKEQEWAQPHPRADPELVKRRNNLVKEIQARWKAAKAAGEPAKKFEADILAFIKTQDEIDSATWELENSLRVFWKGSKFYEAVPMEYVPEPKWAVERSKGWDAQKYELERHEKTLQSGQCAVFTTDGIMSTTRDMRSLVNPVMHNSARAPEEAIDAIAKIFWGNYGAALDIYENYSESEWKED